MPRCHNENCNEQGENVSLVQIGGDNGGSEWYIESYECPVCRRRYTRKITYKVHSNLIADDVLIDDLTGEEVE